MKITILPFEKKEEAPDSIMLYNLVKRWEEDLKSANPFLTQFNLEIKMHPTFIKYHSNPKVKYSIANDGATVHLMVASHHGQQPDEVYKVIKNHMQIIRDDQYHP